ncbi:YdbC family protein [Gudongella sp. SC589]|jgi:hypothetical protein|uniref:YdbC family protein n=1 Tax=Gudongella sp. SC589 TaxID=3385990 RepID=UPI0039046EDB
MAEIKFEITDRLGEISESPRGWKKEINMVSWNNYPAKYDIREWDPDHEKMGKGVTFNKDEIRKLRDILNQLNLED